MLYSRNLNSSDLNYIKECLYSHNTIYGVPIPHDIILSRFSEHLKSQKVIGSFEGDKCLGVCTQLFWDTMPIWSGSNLYINVENTNSLFVTRKKMQIIGSLLETMIQNGEKDHRYEFYYITRDSENQTKKNKAFETILKSHYEVAYRYFYIDTLTLRKSENVKFEFVNIMLGELGKKSLLPPYNKTLILRKGVLKPEFWPKY